MSLNWNLTAIKDYKALCWVENKDEGAEKTFKLNPVTEVIIFMTMAVDLGDLTAKNLKEFYWRMKFLEKFNNYKVLVGKDKRGYLHSYNPTFKQLEQHIGLKVNVSDKTRAQFLKRWMKVFEQDINEAIYTEFKGKGK